MSSAKIPPSSRIPDVARRWWRHADAATTVSSLPPLVAVAAVIAVSEDDRARPPQASAGSDWFDRGCQSGRCGSEENIVDRDGPTPRASSAAAAIAAPEGDRALPP
ncbi:Os09g0110625 [Oryza sativa Japonica Group]|uniref:Os09g0110625 protein n=1 Tax=Oryza sativa subsp. japonica TaxID=39947 RepID=A0A0N7KQC4_ORYSJ|nr:Os09g0110625 [Oryza sativa Japonica Group]